MSIQLLEPILIYNGRMIHLDGLMLSAYNHKLEEDDEFTYRYRSVDCDILVEYATHLEDPNK